METIPIVKAVVRRVAQHAKKRRRLDAHRSGYWSGKVDSSYPYGVWLKHLVLLAAHGMPAPPKSVAEFGPGDSLGVGLSALLSGATRYCGLDAADFALHERDLQILDHLAERFAAHEPRPVKGWPDFDEHLDSSLFPHHILHDSVLREALRPDRVATLKAALVRLAHATSDSPIRLIAPWNDKAPEFEPEYEMLLSHSVLQYVSDLGFFFDSCVRLLLPGGWMSHQIDFSSMGLSRDWNGHLAYPAPVWRFMVGSFPFAPKRKLLSEYMQELKRAGLEVVAVKKLLDDTGLNRHQVAAGFRHASDEDLACRGAFVIARKPM